MPQQSDNIISLMDQLHNQQWSTRVDLGMDDNPDDAARASQIAEATGRDAGAIYDNLEDNDRALKQNLSHQIVQSDPWMQNYVNSHPLAAKISNDDYGKLATAGESYRKVAAVSQRPWWEIGSAGIARGIQSGGGTIIGGLGRMFDSPNLTRIGKQLLDSIDTAVPLSEEDQQRIAAQVGEGIGQMLTLLPGAAAGGVGGAALIMGVQAGETEAQKAEKAGRPEEAADVFTGGFAMGTSLGMLPLSYLDKIGGFKVGQGIINWASQALQEAIKSGAVFGVTGELQAAATSLLEHETFDPNAKYSFDTTRMVSNIVMGAIMGPSFGLIKPWQDAGERIPPGVHPLTDRILIEKTKVDNDALDQAVKDAQVTATKERSPEFMERYYKVQPDAAIGLDGEKVLELYGDKPPTPDDGILGWVPNIKEQLDAARRDGGDIHIKLAEYLARIDPKIDKELHDFRRVDPGGLTIDDAKNLAAGTAPGAQEEEEPAAPVRTAFPEIAGEEKAPIEAPQAIPIQGALADSTNPAVDAVRKQLGVDKILPVPTYMKEMFGGQVGRPLVERRKINWRANAGVRNTKEFTKYFDPTGTGAGTNFKVEGVMKASEVLANVDTKILSEMPKVLHQFFSHQLQRIAGDVPVYIVKQAEMDKKFGAGSPAFYMESGAPAPNRQGGVVMAEELFEGKQGYNYAAHAIIHEVAHAASVEAIDNDPALKAELKNIILETARWITKNEPEAWSDPGINYAFKGMDKISERFGIHTDYEFVAQAYSEPEFQKLLQRIPMSDQLRQLLGGPVHKNLWEAARSLFKRALGKIMGREVPDNIMDSMFMMGQKFQAWREKILGGELPGEKAGEPFIEPPGPTLEERQLFESSKTLGYSQKHWQRLWDKIKDKWVKDLEFHKAEVEKVEQEQLSEEWKERAEKLRPDAEHKVNTRSDIAADRFFRTGISPDGSKVTRVRLNSAKIEPDVLKLMDPEHYGTGRKFGDPGVVNPDDVAGMFGYLTGDQMVHDLASLHQQRQTEGLTPAAHISHLKDVELERMMKAQYGSFDDELLERVRDHVINDGLYDFVHEDALRLGQKYGITPSWTKKDIQAMALHDLDDGMTVGKLKSERLADNTGRIGRDIEEAEGKGDGKEVIRLAQQREISLYKTIEARKFEKFQASVEKIMKRHRQLELKNFKTEEAAPYDHAIKLLMGQLGEPFGRSGMDRWQRELQARGWNSVGEFVDAKQNEGWPLAVSDWVKDGMKSTETGQPHQVLGNLTIGEAKSFYSAIKSLDKNGRDTFTLNREGDALELEPIKNAILNSLERWEAKGRTADGIIAGPTGRLFRHYFASLINMERFMNHIDGDNPRGAANQSVTRIFSTAVNRRDELAREYGGMLKELGPPPGDISKTIQLPFKVPSTGMDFARATVKDKLTIALNAGTVENWTKFYNGWKVDPAVLETWLMQNMSKEEWQWVQGIWKIFDAMKVDMDREYRRGTGTAPDMKMSRILHTPYGDIEGGYFQLNHDAQEIGKGTRTATVTTDDGKNFLQEAIPNPHARQVTGAEYPVSMNLDKLPNTVAQIIHDIAWRNPLHEMQKILNDKQIRQSITNHMGKQWEEQITPWLEFVAHSGRSNSAAALEGQNISDILRQNTISYLVGLNPSTVLKHGPTAWVNSMREIGTVNFMKAINTVFTGDNTISDHMWQFAMNTSEELQRRERFWQETFGGVYKDFTARNWRDVIVAYGAKPVAFSDKLSAVPTWIGAYQKALASGMDKGEAIFEADRAVRFAHGSTAITNLPMFARGKGIHSWMTSLYGFFGTMMQNRMEIAWKLNDAWNLGMHGEIGKAARILPVVAADTFAYIIWPTVVEEYVTGLWTDDRRGWGQRVAWAIAGGLASSYLYARDIVHGLEYGQDAAGGMLTTAIKPLVDAVNDPINVMKGKWPKEGAGKFVKDAIAMTMYTHGVPKELGNLAQYGWDTLIANRETPYTGLMKNWYQFGDLGLGLTRGTQKYTIRR